MSYTHLFYRNFCAEWMEEKWEQEDAMEELAKRLNCCVRCAYAVDYLYTRSRGSGVKGEQHIQKLIEHGKKTPKFDWNSVYRGEESEEMLKNF